MTMIVYMNVENFALIDRAEVFPGPGLNVFTGETGAGKSLIVDAISFVCGGRLGSSLAKDKTKNVSAELILDMSGYKGDSPSLQYADEEMQLLLSRTCLPSGKSVYRINGSAVTQAEIRTVTDSIIDIHGQNEHQTLLTGGAQLRIIDSLSPDNEPLLAGIAKSLRTAKELRDALESQQARREEIRDLAELYEFQMKEIDSAELKEDELEQLEAELQKLKNTDRIMSLVSEAHSCLSRDNGVSELLSLSQRAVSDASGWDPSLAETAAALSEALSVADDCAGELSAYMDTLDLDERRLDYLFERIELIKKLCKKYGGSYESVMATRQKIGDKLSLMSDPESSDAALRAGIAEAESRLGSLCASLSDSRRKCAEGFQKRVMDNLAELGMENTLFEARFTPHSPTPRGAESVDFYISPNKGAEPTPLAKTASGGELSRISLAIMLAARESGVPVLIFDEIDAGIGGVTGENVGKRLRELSKDAQILCVTHLTQIAAKGDAHFCVSKSFSDTATNISVAKLDSSGRVKEISRMFGDTQSAVAIKHAKELLNLED